MNLRRGFTTKLKEVVKRRGRGFSESSHEHPDTAAHSHSEPQETPRSVKKTLFGDEMSPIVHDDALPLDQTGSGKTEVPRPFAQPAETFTMTVDGKHLTINSQIQFYAL